MTSPIDIAVIGAGDPVAEAFLDLLSEHRFPLGRVYALGAADAIGDDVNFGQVLLDIGDVARFDFARTQVAVFFGDPALTREQAPRARSAGCLVIDGSGAFAGTLEVPLVVPQVNPDRLPAARERGVISSPGHAAVALASVLAPLNQAAGIERVDIVCLEPVSSAGKAAVDELGQQAADLLSFRDLQMEVFPQQIAFNLLPQVGDLDDRGHSAEERRIASELQRLFVDPGLPVTVTAIRVPVFYGHAAIVHLQTTRLVSVADAIALIGGAPDVAVISGDAREPAPTPVTDVNGSERVLVSRIREAGVLQNGLNLWIVSDNIRRGTAFNCLRILETWGAEDRR